MARKKRNTNQLTKWISRFQVPWLMEYQGKGITRLVVLLFSMMLILIFLSNHFERKRKYLNKTKDEVERLRSSYLRAQAEYEYEASPNVVKQKTESLGYIGLDEPVKVVEYYPSEYANKQEK